MVFDKVTTKFLVLAICMICSIEPLVLKENKIDTAQEYNLTITNDLREEIPLDDDILNFTYTTCLEKNIDFELVLAIIYVESRFTPNIVSDSNCYGLMQINGIHKNWLRDYGITDLLDPKQNILAGTLILKSYFEKYGEEYGLMAYNSGDKKTLENKNNKIKETSYTKRVNQKMLEYKKFNSMK